MQMKRFFAETVRSTLVGGLRSVVVRVGLLAAVVGLGPTARAAGDDEAALWSLRPLKAGSPPEVKNEGWVRTGVDRFIVARLEANRIAPSPAADKRTLIRRVTFDLVGLPPTPAEVDAFLADDSPTAFETLAERLLDSPHYGERWARHWLDVARYAESEGFKADETRSYIWRYRDYVIRAFNEDKPFDRFVREQIAGDELWPDDTDARVATAFNRHYPDESNARNLMQRRQEILHDITDTVGAAFLGLTVGCAKCHDHKYDPISQQDYYRLQAFFANVRANDEIPLVSRDELRRYEEKLARWEEKTETIRKEMAAIEAPAKRSLVRPNIIKYPDEVRSGIDKPAGQRTSMDWWYFHKARHYLNPSRSAIIAKIKGEAKKRWKALDAELQKYADLHPGELPLGAGVVDVGRDPLPTHVLSIGLYDRRKEKVEPGFPRAVDDRAPVIQPLPELNSSGRRTALANWMADPKNPLTARVIVNRIWHYHFGRGIVATPSDFGNNGRPPTHPALLDWLTADFIEHGWSIKHLHRLILASAVYQQASNYRADAAAADPENQWWWRFPRQRLEGEVLRDSALAVAGMLNRKRGGPSVMPALPPGMRVGYSGWKTTKDEAERNRRSIYVFVRRNTRYPLFEAFDMPDTHESCPARSVTTTAPQALMMLNSELSMDWARGFAGRVLRSGGPDLEAQVRYAYRLAYAREPAPAELDIARSFFKRHQALLAARAKADEKLALPADTPADVDRAYAATLVDFCHMLMNSSEFLYRG